MASLRNVLFPEPVDFTSPKVIFAVLLIGFFACVPVYANLAGQPFYLTMFGRIMIYALAALSLNLLIGYTGLVSLGHALYLGLGAYAVGILSFHGITNGWIHIAAALGTSVVVGVLTGLICLRTQGMAFIMITLAFAQMFFFLGISLKNYGGDDGMRLEARSNLWPLDLSSNTQLYYLVFGLLMLTLYFSWRLVHARFGFILRGIKSNERRMKAMGYATLKAKLAVYVLSACLTSLAGVLLANLTSYTSPSYSAWTVSGEIIVMVVLGGMHTLIGPIVGATALLLFEEFLSSYTTHWQLALGALIVIIIVALKQGLYGSLVQWQGQRRTTPKPAAGSPSSKASKP
jgi:branched-chain amino acid transport system permease protein